MKVLRIIKSVNPGGGGPIEGLLQQARYLMANGITTEVVCLDDPTSPFVKSFPLTVYPLGVRQDGPIRWRRFNPLVHYGYAPDFVPWLRAHLMNYDLAVVEGLWNYSVMGARQALVGSGTSYVVFSHGMLDPWFKKKYPLKNLAKQFFWLFCEGPLLNSADAVLFTCEEEKLVARNAFWPYRVKESVVGFGTSDIAPDDGTQIAAFRAAIPDLGQRPFLLYLSRIHPKKGCDLLLDAFAEVAGANPDVDLVIAGPDRANWLPMLQAQAKALGIEKRVHWPGMLMGDVKWGAFRSAEAFVLPSHQENFGVVVAEAMAAARPVLITNKVNIWREVEASGGGLVDTDDKAGIVRLLSTALAMSTEDRDRMGARARTGFLAHFEISKAGEDIEDAFKAAVSRSKGCRAEASVQTDNISTIYDIQDLSRFRVPPGFRGRSAAIVALWWIVDALLFRTSPAVLYGWRRFLLRLFGARIGKKARIKPTVRITYPWKVAVGDYSWIGQRVELYSLGPITIGNSVCISQDAYLCTGYHNRHSVEFSIHSDPIVVEDEAWVASQAFVMPGVTIGRGAVVGVRSLVLADVAAETVVVGQPAHLVGPRNVVKVMV